MDAGQRIRVACLLTILHDLESRGHDITDLEAEIWCLRNSGYSFVGRPTIWSEMGLKDLLRVIARTPNREHLVGLMVCTSKQL